MASKMLGYGQGNTCGGSRTGQAAGRMNRSGWKESNKSSSQVPDQEEDPERVPEDRRLQADDSLPVIAVRSDSAAVCPRVGEMIASQSRAAWGCSPFAGSPYFVSANRHHEVARAHEPLTPLDGVTEIKVRDKTGMTLTDPTQNGESHGRYQESTRTEADSEEDPEGREESRRRQAHDQVLLALS